MNPNSDPLNSMLEHQRMDEQLSQQLIDSLLKNLFLDEESNDDSSSSNQDIKLPNGLSYKQLNRLISDSSSMCPTSLNNAKKFHLKNGSFYPNLDETVFKSQQQTDMKSKLPIIDLSMVTTNPDHQINGLITKQLSKMIDIINKGNICYISIKNNAKLYSPSLSTNQKEEEKTKIPFRSDFKPVTYFHTEPNVPTKLLSTNNQQSNSTDEFYLEILFQDMQFSPYNLLIVSHLDMQAKLDLLVMINNNHCQNEQPCRIVYLQSLSILAYWMALKANENYNDRWSSIGYQIPLESKTSLSNSIIFFEVTTFVRVLNENPDLNLITHLFIDVGGEGNNYHLFFNLLFLFLKENQNHLNHLKVFILTSNQLQSQQMKDYFYPKVDIIDVREKSQRTIQKKGKHIQYHFLEDIAPYWSSCQVFNKATNIEQLSNPNLEENNTIELILNECWLKKIECWEMVTFFQLCSWLVNYQSKLWNGITPLITAVIHGTHTDVYQLLAMGADCQIRSWNQMNAFEWSLKHQRYDIFQLLLAYQYATYPSFDLCLQQQDLINDSIISHSDIGINQFKKDFKQELVFEVNNDLILNLLKGMIYQMHMEKSFGSILIILPSANSVSTLRKLILSTMGQFEYEFTMVCIYPNVSTNELNAGMGTLSSCTPNQQVKVILSTFNVDCILFQDIHFVINTGIVLEKIHTVFSSINLFRLSANRTQGHKTMEQVLFNQKYATVINVYNLYRRDDPLNSAPVGSLMNNQATDSLYHCIFMAKCFQFKTTTTISNGNSPTLELFDRMIYRPNPQIISTAIIYLQNINVLNENEEMTELGKILIDLAIEPHYAKMIIYSVILRCLDPILTIVCSLSWSIPSLHTQVDHQSSNDSLKGYSDHLAYVYAFQKWQEIYRNHNNHQNVNKQGNGESFKQETSIYHSFEMIYSLRTKILGQLRAIGFVKGKGSMSIRHLNVNSNNFSLVKAAICAGQPFDHFAVRIHNNDTKTNSVQTTWQCYGPTPDEIIYVDPNSILTSKNHQPEMPANYPSNVIMFDRKIHCGSMSFLQNCTLINPLTMAIFVDESYITTKKPSDNNGQYSNEFILNDNFCLIGQDLDKILAIRKQWQQFSRKRLYNMQQMISDEEELFLRDLIHLINISDEKLGFGEHPNIGRAPKVMSAYFCSTIQIKK